MQDDTPHRVGAAVVGLGVGEQHALACLRHPACQLRWVYDLLPKKAHGFVERHGVGRVATSYEEILADPEVQLVCLASFDDMHFQQTVAALQAGKHVFVEKPLCRSRTELAVIHALWRGGQGKLHLSSNLVLRAAPLYDWLRRAIHAGLLGTVYAIDGDYLYGRIHKITEGWRKDLADYSVMMGGGIHLVDLMLWISGQRPSHVHTVGNKVCTHDVAAFRYNDFMAATFTFASGLVGRITANFGCVHRHHHVLRVFGDRGTFVYDDQGPRLHTSRDPALLAAPLALDPLPSHKGVLIPDFVEGLVTGRDATPSVLHEFDLISACSAADDALAAGRAVAIDYMEPMP
ncbi:MAG: Gfo/Idh/MocA family oxidoreductase [Magnetococcales bacterium]|nr:Gfo/Idh/MocA family oxidoreductase [Magnetococcales bacterium]MBF0321492.1 Gfo/Idh/MocA family oxidoreductase [Magnetococcales bacterium]